MLVHVTGQVGKAIQDHAPDSCREIVVANQDIFEVGIRRSGVDALMDARIQVQGLNDGGRMGIEGFDSPQQSPQRLPLPFRGHPGGTGRCERFKLVRISEMNARSVTSTRVAKVPLRG